jgi:hypothetical protein
MTWSLATWLDREYVIFHEGKIVARLIKFHYMRATSNVQVKDDDMGRGCRTNGGDKI